MRSCKDRKRQKGRQKRGAREDEELTGGGGMRRARKRIGWRRGKTEKSVTMVKKDTKKHLCVKDREQELWR